MFADPHTETENDTPNASKSIIKVHNGNISLAGDESSLLGGRLNETLESDINTSRNEGGEGRAKGLTFGGKKEVHSNKILGEEFHQEEYGRVSEMNTRRSKVQRNKVENDFEPNQLVDEKDQDLKGIHRKVIYDQSENIKGKKAKNIRYSEKNEGTKASNAGKTNSLTVKTETRIIKNGGDRFEGGNEQNFGSSEEKRGN